MMCKECGCGLPGDTPVRIGESGTAHEHAHTPGVAHSHQHEHGHSHSHDHEDGESHEHEHGPGLHHREEHEHSHPHRHSHPQHHEHPAETAQDAAAEPQTRTLEVRKAILDQNDRLAERNRGFFRARGLLVLNVLSSPGSGKTTLLTETLRMLGPDLKAGVIVGDLATDNDAQRLRSAGAPVVQITTGTVCHLEAAMVASAVNRLELSGLRLLIIENVGNLVCPASYDLGEDLRVVMLSVTEGEDKPLKYPPMFQSAQVVVLSKMDLAGPCGFNREEALRNIGRAAPNARIFETSAKTGTGMAEWRNFLVTEATTSAKRGLD